MKLYTVKKCEKHFTPTLLEMFNLVMMNGALNLHSQGLWSIPSCLSQTACDKRPYTLGSESPSSSSSQSSGFLALASTIRFSSTQPSGFLSSGSSIMLSSTQSLGFLSSGSLISYVRDVQDQGTNLSRVLNIHWYTQYTNDHMCIFETHAYKFKSNFTKIQPRQISIVCKQSGHGVKIIPVLNFE